MIVRRLSLLLIFFVLLFLSGCASSVKVHTSQAFTISQSQKMLPIVPFSNTLVPEDFSEGVFNDFVDGMNDHQEQAGFTWFGIVKDDLGELEKILSPLNIYLTGEIWSYIEDSGCCSTELRVKSRLRIHRVMSKEMLWEAEIPLDRFFEHDSSTLPVEREKIGKSLSAAMITESVKALQKARRISID